MGRTVLKKKYWSESEYALHAKSSRIRAKKFNLPFGQNYFKQNVSITLENMMLLFSFTSSMIVFPPNLVPLTIILYSEVTYQTIALTTMAVTENKPSTIVDQFDRLGFTQNVLINFIVNLFSSPFTQCCSDI